MKKILLVIHGYPPRYNAGSEIYTQTIAHGLAKRGYSVSVFTRQEDSFLPDYHLSEERDPLCEDIKLYVINIPRSRYRDRYRHRRVDEIFEKILRREKPDLVHINHLNHLSTSIVEKVADFDIPIVYTLHDYWLICPRGQLLQIAPPQSDELWPICPGQDDRRCAENCYASRMGSGASEDWEEDVSYWESWVRRRRLHLSKLVETVDLFVSPARHLSRTFKDYFQLPDSKITYLDYGFDLERLKGRKRVPEPHFVFGYIGRQVHSKGIDLLLKAFAEMKNRNALLRIWGRPNSEFTPSLKNLVNTFPPDVKERIQWLPEYKNTEIVREVFDRVDAIVVPSIWYEISPLVIHEALQAKVPVITANMGGMAEHITDGLNGLTFEPRNIKSLAEKMDLLVDDPQLRRRIASYGYLYSDGNRDIPSISEHVEQLESLYSKVLLRRKELKVSKLPGPWRITFETNPDTCNLGCIMCECHSPFSPIAAERKEKKLPHRFLDFELIDRIVSEAVPLGLREIIPTTMGEPLLYKDFEKFVELCRRHQIKLNVTTNGTFPRLGPERWAELIAPVCSDIKISINGATPETQEKMMPGAPLDKVLDNVRKFIQVRDKISKNGGNHCRVTFQLTFTLINCREFPQLLKIAADLGVERIKGHHLWVNFPELQPYSLRQNPETIAIWNEVVAEMHRAAREYPLPDGKQIILENFFPLSESGGEELSPDGVCPFLGREAWVSVEGRFDPCCAPDKERAKLGRFPNLKTTSLSEIWNSPQYNRLMKNYFNHSVCIGCNMRVPLTKK